MEDIARVVAGTKITGSLLRISKHAARLFAAYPGANFSLGRIIDELVAAAAAAKVAVEISRPKTRQIDPASLASNLPGTEQGAQERVRLMTEPQAVAIFLNRIAGELERLKNQTSIVSETAPVDLSSLLHSLDAAIVEARRRALTTSQLGRFHLDRLE